MLSRKHYIEFARMLKDSANIEDFQVSLIEFFQADNERFDAERFLDAVKES